MSRKLMAMMLAIGLVIGLVGGFFGGYFYKNFTAEEGGGDTLTEYRNLSTKVLFEPKNTYNVNKTSTVAVKKVSSSPFHCPKGDYWIPNVRMPFYESENDESIDWVGPSTILPDEASITKNPKTGFHVFGEDQRWVVSEKQVGDVKWKVAKNYSRIEKGREEPSNLYQLGLVLPGWEGSPEKKYYPQASILGSLEPSGKSLPLLEDRIICTRLGTAGTGGSGE